MPGLASAHRKQGFSVQRGWWECGCDHCTAKRAPSPDPRSVAGVMLKSADWRAQHHTHPLLLMPCLPLCRTLWVQLEWAIWSRVWGRRNVSMAGCQGRRPELGSSEKKTKNVTKNRTAECMHQVWEPGECFFK